VGQVIRLDLTDLGYLVERGAIQADVAVECGDDVGQRQPIGWIVRLACAQFLQGVLASQRQPESSQGKPRIRSWTPLVCGRLQLLRSWAMTTKTSKSLRP
jgi:hypothetical protein